MSTITNAKKIYYGPKVIQKIYLGTATGSVLLFPESYDLLTGIVAAYSFYRVKSNYVGSCCKVRRQLDNTEQDINLLIDGLDEAELLTFNNSGDSNIVTWYDQSGNNHHASQIFSTKQPLIVKNSSIITTNNSPMHLYCDRVDDYLEVELTGNTNYYVIFSTWSGVQLYEIETDISGLVELPINCNMLDCVILDNSQDVENIKGIVARFIDGNSTDIFRLKWVNAGDKTLTITESSDAGITWEDSQGFITGNTYNRTVNADDWFVARSTNPEYITDINWRVLSGGDELYGELTNNEKLSNLEDFYFRGQKTTGNVNKLLSLNNLKDVWLHNANNLFGDISFLNSALDLEDLEISFTKVGGDISVLANKFKIKRLWLQSNDYIYGSIDNINSLFDITDFRISSCYENIYGNIASLDNNVQLLVLICYDTNISGNINELTNLPLLRELRFFRTQVTGTIISMPGLTKYEGYNCLLNDVESSFLPPTSLVDFDVRNNLLTSTNIDTLLTGFDDAGATNGILALEGNASPTSIGITARNNLITKGWTVTTD